MLPSSSDRVPSQTAEDINEEIRRDTERSVALFASAGREAINNRLKELDREWDIDRVVETHAAGASLLGLLLGARVNRKFYIVPAVMAGFLLHYALRGWSPPMVVFRRMGIRTAAEIAYERYALKAFRGDFGDITTAAGFVSAVDAGKVLEAVKA